MAQVTIPEEMVNAAVQKAIFDSLTPEMQAEMLAAAIKHLCEAPHPGGHGNQKYSPLQVIMNECAEKVLRDYAREKLLGDDDFKNRIDGLIEESLMKVLAQGCDGGGTPREKLIERMVNKIADAFRSEW